MPVPSMTEWTPGPGRHLWTGRARREYAVGPNALSGCRDCAAHTGCCLLTGRSPSSGCLRPPFRCPSRWPTRTGPRREVQHSWDGIARTDPPQGSAAARPVAHHTKAQQMLDHSSVGLLTSTLDRHFNRALSLETAGSSSPRPATAAAWPRRLARLPPPHTARQWPRGHLGLPHPRPDDPFGAVRRVHVSICDILVSNAWAPAAATRSSAAAPSSRARRGSWPRTYVPRSWPHRVRFDADPAGAVLRHRRRQLRLGAVRVLAVQASSGVRSTLGHLGIAHIPTRRRNEPQGNTNEQWPTATRERASQGRATGHVDRAHTRWGSRGHATAISGSSGLVHACDVVLAAGYASTVATSWTTTMGPRRPHRSRSQSSSLLVWSARSQHMDPAGRFAQPAAPAASAVATHIPEPGRRTGRSSWTGPRCATARRPHAGRSSGRMIPTARPSFWGAGWLAGDARPSNARQPAAS